MVLVLKKGATKQDIQKIEKKLLVVHKNNFSKFFGKLKLKEDPMTIQKSMRNEWK